ncbi:testis-specific serine/threonine-protein kinase 5 [Alligator mississippiensis]|uniref:non-specific serine/threonine protein kinase n=1 Tax=Alligator mississippiensis TaxID=8496 RepID=A0A151NVN8_ALLMI|nr:testis-specific serine/threonine-protein kinase 5 [Alligator mississippiensis]KYO40926.1 testis-specific serine/threonine-protein kinase 5-like [Alligator mississippiensis]
MKSSSRHEADRKTLLEQARESKENGYLLSAKKIGAGAFSKVYLAHALPDKVRHNCKLAADLRGKRHSMVAIKIISTAKAPLEYARKFLPREIYCLNATYKHGNVIQLYETYRTSKRTYLVLELAARGDLLEHINATSDLRQRPGLEEGEARRLFRQIVSAVAHCHGVGVVHRDLKCENILLDERGFIKLTDFGFASRCSLKTGLMSTFCGSVAYTAPEILMSKKYNGELADLWSLGVILYAMVTGKLPFRERQPHKMIHLVKQGVSFRQAVSPECQDLIRGLLQLKPGARLGLQQVAAHCWMLPAASAIFHPVPSSGPERTSTHGEGGGHATALSDPERMPQASAGLGKGAQGLPAPRTRSTQDAGPSPAETASKRPPPGCRLQADRPPRLSLARPSLLSAFRPFCQLPNFRKPGSAVSASAYTGGQRLSAAGTGVPGSGPSKPAVSLYSLSLLRKLAPATSTCQESPEPCAARAGTCLADTDKLPRTGPSKDH